MTNSALMARLAALAEQIAAVVSGALGLSNAAPQPPGVVSAGAGTLASRDDHVHAAQTSVTGNAGTATALQTARNIAGVSFNGTADIAITTATVADSTNKRYVTDANLTLIGNTSGVNSGDVTLAAFGSSPDAKGATISGQAIALQPADATHPGGISLFAQPLGAGTKTVDALTSTGTLTAPGIQFAADGNWAGRSINNSALFNATTGDAVIRASGSIYLAIDSNNDETTQKLVIQKDSNVSGGTELFSLTEAGVAALTGSLAVSSFVTVNGNTGLGQTARHDYAADFGSVVADIKAAIYSDGTIGNSAGFGIRAGDFRAFCHSSNKLTWHSAYNSGTPMMSLPGSTGILDVAAANGITIGGVVVPTISSSSVLTSKTLTTPTINGCTTSGTWSGNSTFSGNLTLSGANTYSGLSTRSSGIVLSNRATTATTVTMGTADDIIRVSAALGATTVNLQAAATAGAGRRLTVIKTEASANAVTLDGSGAETINGSATRALAAQYNKVTIVSDGTNWLEVA